MSRRGKSAAMKSQVQEMVRMRMSLRKIAESLGISRNTVRRILRGKEQKEEEAKDPSRHWSEGIDLEAVLMKRRRGRSLKALHEQYAAEVPYSTFSRHVKERLSEKGLATRRLRHNPGEQTFVDYADGICVVDRKTGEKRKTQLFCGVLPFSGLTYAEFSWDQKQESFINSHERMWGYVGGVTQYVVTDNLKSSVLLSHRYDPDLNPTYCEYGNKRGFAVLPARPRTPRDKASVENGIGVIQRSFYQTMAERTFYSIGELNQALREFIDRLNLQVMKDYGVSRRDRFEEEKAHLLPFSEEAYEISSWKEVRVHPDCHVQILKNFYSVPHAYVGRQLRARLREKTIEIFTADGEAVCMHPRSHARGVRVTTEEHYPHASFQVSSYEIQSNLKRAEAIGPKVFGLVDDLFKNPRPLSVLRLVQGILRTAQDFPPEAMEYAAEQAVLHRRCRLAYIASCAKFYPSTQAKKPLSSPPREPSTLHLHQGGERP